MVVWEGEERTRGAIVVGIQIRRGRYSTISTPRIMRQWPGNVQTYG